MNKEQAQTSIKNLHSTASALESSAIINLFEIDVSEIAMQELLYKNKHLVPINSDKIFRFHNNPKLIDSSIWYNNVEYVGAPIKIDGFETTSKGTLPEPKMSITARDESIHNFHLLKQYIRALDSLIGAKVTRTRTFAKYLDSKNFYSSGTTPLNPDIIIPKDLSPDPNAHFPQEVYYIERKANENKLFIEFELTSALALQEVKLPGRVVTSDACAWTYRGEGCCYEYNSLKSASVHGDASLPNFAPPLANEKNELIEESIPEYDPADWRGNVPPLWKGSSESGGSYSKGTVVRILVKGVNYYFVAKTTVPVDAPPPNDKFWMADQCSKKVTGCKWRWGTYSATNDHGAGSPPVTSGGGNPKNGHLPFGGFPGVTSAADSL